MTIYITGDTHADLNIEKIQEAGWRNRDWRPTPDDYLIVVGDVAVIWDTQWYELPDLAINDAFTLGMLTELPWTVLFIDGNHENHRTLHDMESELWNGGYMHRISERCLHLMRGQVFNIEDIRLFTLGGAFSVDRSFGEEGEYWYVDEMPSEEEYDEARANLKAAGGKVDIVLTHTCPTEIVEEVLDTGAEPRPDELTDFLQWVWETIDFKHWFFGHFHRDVEGLGDGRFTCVMDAIYQIDSETGFSHEIE